MSLLTKRLADRDMGLLPHQSGMVRMSVLFDALDTYLREERQAKSLKSIRIHLKPVRQFFSTYRASQVTTRLISQYTARRQALGRAPATINRETGLLGQALTLGIHRQLVLRTPHIPKLRVDNVREGFFTRQELEAILAHLPAHLHDPAWFAYYTGWRKGEICGLEWRQVDLAAGVIRLAAGRTKNRRGRTLTIEGPLVPLFAKRAAERTANATLSPWVFHRKGHQLTDFLETWRRACRKAGLPHKLFHDFRRTAARNMIRAGVPQRIAQEITGHKTAAMFDRYNIVDEADVREAMAKVGAYTEPQQVRKIRGES